MTTRIVADQPNNPMIAQWVIDHMPEEGFSSIHELGPHVAFGVMRDGRALCGLVYNWYREMPYGADMRAILYSDHPSWCLPGVLRELFRYPFDVARCQRLTAIVRDGNEAALKLNLGLGFRKEGILRRGYDGRTNAIVLGMLRHECKWLHRGVAPSVEEGQFSPAPARSERNGGGAVRGKRTSRAGKRKGQRS